MNKVKTPFYLHSEPSNNGRVTVSAVLNGTDMSFGVAKCSIKDSFIKEKGRRIAHGRAAKAPCKVVKVPHTVVESGQYGKFFVEEAKKLADETLQSNTLPKPIPTGRSLFAKAINAIFG